MAPLDMVELSGLDKKHVRPAKDVPLNMDLRSIAQLRVNGEKSSIERWTRTNNRNRDYTELKIVYWSSVHKFEF